MKRIVLCIAALTLSVQLAAQSSVMGKSEAEMLSLKGKPIAKTVAGSKAIYRWSDIELSFTNGVVTSYKVRDAKKEAELRQHSQKASQEAAQRKAQAEAQQKKNKAINEKYQADSLALHKATEEREKIERERKEYDAAIAASNAVGKTNQLSADAKEAQIRADVQRAMQKQKEMDARTKK